MSKSEGLSNRRKGTVINLTSSRQEIALVQSICRVIEQLKELFPNIRLNHFFEWKLKYITEQLKEHFTDTDFICYFNSSSMRPDGGILSIVDKEDKKYPILISEKKNQGTNKRRALEGKSKQAKGNAIERLGKNVIGFRTALKHESIFPFVCFGDGCDFAPDSSILDRIVTIAQFGHLNKVYLHKQSDGAFDRGAFYFREQEWSEQEMYEICLEIAECSVHYYFSKYGKNSFV